MLGIIAGVSDPSLDGVDPGVSSLCFGLERSDPQVFFVIWGHSFLFTGAVGHGRPWIVDRVQRLHRFDHWIMDDVPAILALQTALLSVFEHFGSDLVVSGIVPVFFFCFFVGAVCILCLLLF